MIRALTLSLVLATSAVAQTEPQPIKRITLDDAIKLALERNYDIQRQMLLTLSSEQDRIIARSAILPSLDFNASSTVARINGTQFSGNVPIPGGGLTTVDWNHRLSGTITQLVFDGGKWWNNLSGADLTLQASRATLDEQRLQTVYLVEQRFYELIRAQRQLQVLSEAATRSRDQADFVQRLFEGGRATQADVYAARANRDNDEVVRLGAERTVELARADLAVSIGVETDEALAVVEPQRLFEDPSQPPAAREAIARAMDNRPALKAAQLTVQAGHKFATAARGDYWPRISLQGGYSRSSSELSTTYTRDPRLDSQFTAGVLLTWNVFNGFNTSAQANKADLQAALSENDLFNARRNVASDVEKAVAQLATARSQARVAVETEKNAQENLRLAHARQQVGVGTQLEVRDAELKLTQAQLFRVGALVDGREAEAALRRAQGG